MNVFMHSYTFRNYPLESACQNASRFDWDGLELQQAHFDQAALDRLEGRIGYFHFKNCVQRDGVYDFSVRLAEGHIDSFKYVQKLVQMRYNGPVCIEYCGAGDPMSPPSKIFSTCAGACNGLAWAWSNRGRRHPSE